MAKSRIQSPDPPDQHFLSSRTECSPNFWLMAAMKSRALKAPVQRGRRASALFCLRVRATIQLARRLVEILEERGTEPMTPRVFMLAQDPCESTFERPPASTPEATT